MDITGKIIVVCPAKSGVSQKSGNPWKSQEFVLETEGSHPEKCVFSVFGEDKLNEFNLKVNEVVSVSINLDAREYNGRWFNSLQAWRVMRSASATAAPQAPVAPQANPAPFPSQPQAAKTQEPEDDLPF